MEGLTGALLRRLSSRDMACILSSETVPQKAKTGTRITRPKKVQTRATWAISCNPISVSPTIAVSSCHVSWCTVLMATPHDSSGGDDKEDDGDGSDGDAYGCSGGKLSVGGGEFDCDGGELCG